MPVEVYLITRISVAAVETPSRQPAEDDRTLFPLGCQTGPD